MIEEDEPSLFRECGCKLAKGFDEGFTLRGDDEVPATRLGCRQGFHSSAAFTTQCTFHLFHQAFRVGGNADVVDEVH
jgi:elongation factor P hydroxylase